MVRELGANPTPIPWSEVYTALGYGILDGTKNSIQDMVGMKFQEKVKYLFVDRHAYMAALWWMSDKSWAAIPNDLKPLVEAGFAELKQATRKAARVREKPAIEAFIRAGGKIHVPTSDERQAFINATQGVRQWYARRYGEAWLTRLDEAVVECSRGV
jgi:TRAP-type C4-dicarboxylate transport system substrate-binding protein